MPANLTPQYLEAEKRYKQAPTVSEKLEALEEMLAVIPKHKGTEKLQADLKTRLSKLKGELEHQRKSGGKHDPFSVMEREGAGQLILLGAPNTGKSSLLATLTNATPEIAEYPYTTRFPQPGMMPFENIKIQLVDMPAMTEDFWEPRYSGIIRNADILIILADLSTSEMLDQVETVFSLLEKAKIKLLVNEPGQPDNENPSTKKNLLIGTKSDLDQGHESFKILQELYAGHFETLALSCKTGENLPYFKTRVYQVLGILRVYSKPPGKKADLNDPFILKQGSTVLDAAAHIHKDFAEKLKFARIWGSERFEGQMVHREHVLADGDIVEFHV
ncbi:MAG TPA: GTPase [Terriglobia bacterium]|nr:GTPase [Terriglobia bacterium]